MGAVLAGMLAAACGAPPPRPLPPLPERGYALADSLCPGGGQDSDGDGLSDACELGLASAFAPELVVSPGGCDWDATARRPAGGYLFGVAPTADGGARVAYLPAYHLDCGWSGPKCLIPVSGCDGHTGDSELIALELERSGGRWWVAALVLSAHCFGASRGCAWTRWEELGGLEGVEGRAGGAPVVWVAEGTHAAYASRTGCDRGHRSMDTCDRNAVRHRYPVGDPALNVGSRERPVGGDGCVAAATVDPVGAWTASGARECVWDETGAFRGWRSEDEGTPPTPYGRYLRDVMGW